MKSSQYIFQVIAKPGVLVLFLFSFLGGECGRATGGGTPLGTKQALAEQQAKVEAAEKAAKETKTKKAEAEAEKQRQIKNALQTAAADVLRANEAVKRVAAAKKQVEGTVASGGFFSLLEENVTAAEEKADKAFEAIRQAEEVTAAFNKAEEVALAANKAEQQSRQAEEFVSRFQSQFTFHSHEKALFPSSSDKAHDQQFISQCHSYMKELIESTPFEANPEPIGRVVVSPGCHVVKEGSSHYNCFCEYDKSNKPFYKK